MSDKATRESSLLVGGPRNGRAYWTDDLDQNLTAHHPNSEGYARTTDFTDNSSAPGGMSRVWRWNGEHDGR